MAEGRVRPGAILLLPADHAGYSRRPAPQCRGAAGATEGLDRAGAEDERALRFFTGERNRCFLPQSQESTFRYFDSLEPGRHSYHELRGYSHLDVFMGKNAARDALPLMTAELERPAASKGV